LQEYDMATVLIVDDRESNREVVVASLQRKGYDLIEASDGADALAQVRSKRPQVVISDILMPTMDGYEFARQLRADPEIAHTEIIFYTAHYRAREAQNLADACGVFRVLTKPCEPGDIVRAVEDALESRPAVPLQAPREFSADHVRLMVDKLAEKNAELRAANQRLAALNELNLETSAQVEPHAMLDKVCSGARQLLGAKYAILGVVDGDAKAPPYFSVSGMDHATVAGLGLGHIDRGALGQVLAERRTRSFSLPAVDSQDTGLPGGMPPYRFALGAPVASLGTRFGWICLVDKPGAHEFSVEDEQMLTVLAAQAGRIYEKRLAHTAALADLARLRGEVDRRREAARGCATLAEGLNHNEREIVRLFVAGKSTTEVAEALNLSPRTVETYRARLMHKLGIEDIASLVKFAIRSGIAPLD
jgi:DNA-binding NarL/FixJ family response regulator